MNTYGCPFGLLPGERASAAHVEMSVSSRCSHTGAQSGGMALHMDRSFHLVFCSFAERGERVGMLNAGLGRP